MKNYLILLVLFLSTIPGFSQEKIDYLKETPEDFEQRMEWFTDAKYGMFIHFGLYSQLGGAYKGEPSPRYAEWIQANMDIAAQEYAMLAATFNPENFDADFIAKTAKDAGMKYIVITSKHHDGFAMFQSNASLYNVVDATPYGRDVIKALAEKCHRQGLKICFYYSQSRDWNETDGVDNNWDFSKERNFQKYLDEKVKPQLTELLSNYGSIRLIWFDTPMDISQEQAQSLKDLVRKLQPEGIISGRLGGGVEADYMSNGENVIPATVVPGYWEALATLNNTWGFKKNDHEWKSPVALTRLHFNVS